MSGTPQTRFARNGDVHIAFQAFGEGPDLVLVESWVHHVEFVWDVPEYARLLRRLGSFARVIHFDRRGTGLSDPVPIHSLPDVATQVEDVLAVMDAAGSARASILGVQDGTVVAIHLAADHPARVDRLLLYTTTAGGHSWPDDQIDAIAERMQEALATGAADEDVAMVAPSHVGDARFTERFARLRRTAVRPGAVGHYFKQTMRARVDDVLPRIASPTLVVHRSENQLVPVELGRQAAELIPEARFVEVPGRDHLIFAGDIDPIVDEVEEFLTGMRAGAGPDRRLATVLLTDIVDSTKRAGEIGDRRWRDLLEDHNEVVRRELARFDGHEVHTTGDGFLATFDQPGRAVRCAVSLTQAVPATGVEIRAGLHTGEIEVRGSDIGGLAVHIAARVAARAGAGEVLVSSTVRDLLAGSGIEFEPRGEHELKGVPDTWRLYAART